MAAIAQRKIAQLSAHCARILKPTAAAIAVASCFATGAALANPTGHAVAHGQASVQQVGNLLQITNSPNAIINWRSFSIGTGEITRFLQQSGSSAVLNRVVGAGGAIDPSVILGALQSNGRVFLINPGGIVFGAGAQVDVAGLVASSLNLSNADFLAGRLNFTTTPGAGSIVNQGSITAGSGGQVYLIGPAVTNSGIIASPKGEVVLAAGNSVELVSPGTPSLRVEITAPDNEARNLGQIVADAGRIGIYAGLIQHKGVMRADAAVADEGGRILLKATRSATLDAGSVTSASGAGGGRIEINAAGTTLVGGVVEAKGGEARGGAVHLLGDQVGVHGNARIDASGDAGGGTVLLGGEFQGRAGVTAVEGSAIRNATAAFVGAETSVLANAGTHGDGGKIIVWADDTTRVHGAIRARGGAQSGNGGFVETSGKIGLEVTGAPDVRAPRGIGGTWLLDPNDLDIVAGSGAVDNTSQPFFAPLADSSSIGADLINLQLDFGSNVVLTTTSAGATAGTQAGNITVLAPIVKTATGVGTTSLTLEAHNNIVIGPGGGIASTGDRLNVTLAANSDSSGGGGVTVGGGGIVTNGGSVNIFGQDMVAINAPIDTRFTGQASGGNVSIWSFGNQVVVSAPVTGGSTFSASGSTGVNINAAVTSANNLSLDVSTGPINVIAPVTGDSLSVSTRGAGSLLTVTAPVTVVTGASLIADDMDIQATINAGSGFVSVRPANFVTMNLGANIADSLSLNQAELDNLVTTGPKSFGSLGSFGTNVITVRSPITIGSSSVSVQSSTGFAVVPGAGLAASSPLDIHAPIVTLSGPVSAQQITFTTDTLSVNAPVTSAGDIQIQSFFRPINLGVVADGPSSLDFTPAELNNLVTGASGVLRIGSASSGALSIQGPIAPTGTQTLLLSSGTSVSQAAGATITIPNLVLDVFGSVNLPEANQVGTLAANLCCAGNTFTFTNAPGAHLTIGAVNGISGVSNFDGGNPFFPTSATIIADGLTVSSPVSFDLLTIKPTGTGVTLDLGGADAPGRLGISAADLASLFAGTLTLKADQADITAPVTSSAGVFAVAPMTFGRALNVSSGPKNSANLELSPAEIGNVSTFDTFRLGDADTGPVAVNAAITVPSSIGTFALRSADGLTGIAVSNPISAQNNIALIADAMTLGAAVSSTSGSIAVTTNTSNHPIDLGTKTPGTLGLNAAELGLITASNGPLLVGDLNSGDLTVSAPLTFSTIGDLHLAAGPAGAGGVLGINAALTNTSLGTIHLTSNTMNIGAPVVTGGGDINITAASPATSIALGTKPGGQLGLTAAELDMLDPGSGVLRIGDQDFNKSFNIQVTAPIAPINATTLSLQTANGGVTQTAGSTITIPELAVHAGGSITLTQSNGAGAVALQSDFGGVSYTHAGPGPLTVGIVDGLAGVQAFGGNVTLKSDEMTISQPVGANFGFGTATLLPFTAGQPVALGTKPGASSVLGLLQSELNLISASSLVVGDSGTGNIGVTAPISLSTAGALSLTTAPGNAIAVNFGLTAPGNVTLSTGTLNVAAPLTSSSGTLTAIADNMTLGATVSASTMNLRPVNVSTVINLGGADSISTTNTLGLDATDVGNLAAGTLTIGSTTVSAITVSAPTSFGATTTLSAAGTGTTDVNAALNSAGSLNMSSGTVNANAALSAAGNLTLATDNLTVPGPGGISGGNVTLSTLTSGRTIDLGTAGVGTFLGLDAASLGRITATGTLTVNATGSGSTGTLLVSNPIAYTGAPNLALNAGTLSTTGTLSAPGLLTLRANAMDIANTVSSTGGADISVAPRSSSVMTLGPTGSGLLLSQAEINQFSTTGVLRLGSTSTASSMSITGPISYAPATPLHLAASGSISQTAGSMLTVPNLRVQTNTVTLTDANNVGTIAGTGGNFQFTNNGMLNIGSVDGVNGIAGSTVTLKGDTLAINQPVSGSTVTLAPRVAGAPIDVGSKPGGVFGVSDAEIDLISASTLNIGQTTSGSITVTAPVDRASGNFNLVAQPGSTISVNAAFGAPTASVSMNAGAGGTVNIGAQVTAFSNITLTADNVNIAAPLVATGSTVSILPGTSGLPINVGTETSGALSLTAEELALIGPDVDILQIGNSGAGALTISAPIASATLDQLRLTAGGAITQAPGATITLSDPAGGALQASSFGGGVTLTEANAITGSLNGSASGAGNNFDFNNTLPMKLQNVSASASGGKVRVNGQPAGVVVPSGPGFLGEGSIELPREEVIARMEEQSKNAGDVDGSAQQEKAEQEEKKKESQACR